jgi:hypothetical protein
MSKSPLLLTAAILGAGLLGSAASAQPSNPFAGADCREARLDRVVEGRVASSESVVVCKRTDKLKALTRRDGLHLAVVPPAAPLAVRPSETDRVAFTGAGQPDRECAMLNCPTYVLTGVGD